MPEVTQLTSGEPKARVVSLKAPCLKTCVLQLTGTALRADRKSTVASFSSPQGNMGKAAPLASLGVPWGSPQEERKDNLGHLWQSYCPVRAVLHQT